MLPITFLSHLPPGLRSVITLCLTDGGSVEDNMTIIRLKSPDVAGKCEIYLSYTKSLDVLCLPTKDKELIRTIIGRIEIPLEVKILCIDKVFTKRGIEASPEFRAQTLQFLRHCMPVETSPPPVFPRPPRIPVHPIIPIEESFPILDKIQKELHAPVLSILSNRDLKIPAKFARITKIVTNPEQQNLLKLYLRNKDAEAKLLRQFPEQVQGELAAVIREESLTFQAKTDLLKHILPESGDRILCKEYLGAQKQDERQQKEAITFLKSFPEDEEKMNILVLGETGVGKSTFINGLANYLKYKTLHEAKEKGPEILISTRFTVTRKGTMHTINYPAPGDVDKNENLESGQSATRDPKFYKFFGGNLLGKYREINLLDTPGIGDVKGIGKDGENFEKIFSCLADWRELHAILILLKPNQSRLTECMTYCLGELFGRINKNCARNIIFCCTNTRSSQYTPGDTYPTLGVFLDGIKSKWGVEIPCHRQQVFSFDNESFRFLCASKQIEYDKNHTENFNLSWMNSVSEVFRLLIRINNLRPCKIYGTLNVFNARTVINVMLEFLEESQRNIRNLEKAINENTETRNTLRAEYHDLFSKLEINRVNVVRRTMQNNRLDMVCVQCGVFDEHNKKEKHYKICHQECECPETSTARLRVTSEALVQKCQCFDQETFKCKQCGCPWLSHMKTDQELALENVIEEDTIVKEKLVSNVQKGREMNDLLTQKLEEKYELENQISRIETGIQDLGAYLKSRCLLPYNEYIDGYVQKEIEDLRMQVLDDAAVRDQKIAKLHKLQATYELLVHLLGEMPGVNRIGDEEPNVNDVPTMIRLIQTYYQRKSLHCFKIAARLINIVPFNVRSSPLYRAMPVDIGKGWMSKLRADLY